MYRIPKSHPLVMLFIKAKDAWCVVVIGVLAHLGLVRPAGAVYSVCCLMSECLWVSILNLFRAVGPVGWRWKLCIFLPHSHTNTCLHFQDIFCPSEAHLWPPGYGRQARARPYLILPFFGILVSTVISKRRQPSQKGLLCGCLGGGAKPETRKKGGENTWLIWNKWREWLLPEPPNRYHRSPKHLAVCIYKVLRKVQERLKDSTLNSWGEFASCLMESLFPLFSFLPCILPN